MNYYFMIINFIIVYQSTFLLFVSFKIYTERKVTVYRLPLQNLRSWFSKGELFKTTYISQLLQLRKISIGIDHFWKKSPMIFYDKEVFENWPFASTNFLSGFLVPFHDKVYTLYIFMAAFLLYGKVTNNYKVYHK